MIITALLERSIKMKKLLCIIICILTAFCFVGCKKADEADSAEPPIFELMARGLTDEYDFAIVDEEGTVWLENADVSAVLVMFKKGQNRYLELRFTEDGTEKFKKAIKKNKKGTLSITLDGEVLASPVLANEENPDYAKLTGIYEDVVGWFNKLT